MERKRRISPLAVSAERLADILSGTAAATRAKLSAAGRKGGKARWAKHDAQRKAKWAAEKRAASRGTNAKRQRLGLPGWQVLASRMAPGVWYSLVELRGLVPEYAGKSVDAWLWRPLGGAIVEKAHNPEFDVNRHGRRQLQPQFVFRLGVEGATLAAEWRERLAGGQGSAP